MYFDTDKDFFGFARELTDIFPSRCKDDSGNVCFRVEGIAFMIAEQVDLKELNESDAKLLAGERAANHRCKFGLSLSGECRLGYIAISPAQ